MKTYAALLVLDRLDDGPRLLSAYEWSARTQRGAIQALEMGWVTEHEGTWALTPKGRRALDGHRRAIARNHV